VKSKPAGGDAAILGNRVSISTGIA
jgi:hypothetical protein